MHISHSFFRHLNNNLISLTAIILSGIFLFSSQSKIYYWLDTKYVIESLTIPILNKKLSVILAAGIITIELFLSLLFLMPKFWRFAGLYCMLLVTIFTLVVFWGKSQNLIYECHCFGKIIGAKIGLTLLIRNAIILLLSLYLVVQRRICDNNNFDIQFLSTLKKFNIILLVTNLFFLGRFMSLLF